MFTEAANDYVKYQMADSGSAIFLSNKASNCRICSQSLLMHAGNGYTDDITKKQCHADHHVSYARFVACLQKCAA